MARLTREKAEQLRTLSSQLLLFESRLCRKQKEIEASLAQRESIILRQQRVIRQLQSRLAERSTGTRDSPPCDALDRLDSLGDSDSAVVLEEAADDLAPPRYVLKFYNKNSLPSIFSRPWRVRRRGARAPTFKRHENLPQSGVQVYQGLVCLEFELCLETDP